MNEIEKYKAVYQEGSTPKDNPFIQALPKQLTGKELIAYLGQEQILPEQWNELSPTKRMELVEKLHFLYIPMDYSISTYNLIYRSLRTAYEGKKMADVNQQMEAIGIAIQKKDFTIMPDCEHQADSFSLLGAPGMGKTETINRVLRNIPKVIVHESYFDKKLNQIQIPYIRIQCPSNKSPKAACIQILHELDSILGTDYTVIDEIQNILRMTENAVASKESFISFMVELSNKTGVGIVSVGTPEVERFFILRKHLERRTRGPRIAVSMYDNTYQNVLSKMLAQLPLKEQVALNEGTRELIYKITGGVFSQVASLLISSTEYALSYGLESIDSEIINCVAKMESFSPAKSKALEVVDGLNFNPPTEVGDAPRKNGAIHSTKRRGRPSIVRDAHDLLVIYDNCKKAGTSVPRMLEFKEIAIFLKPRD